MLERVWNKDNTPLLMGVKHGTATLQVSMAVSQKIGNQTTSRPNSNTLGHIPKGCSIIIQGHLLNYVHSTIICNSQNQETS